MKLTAQLLNDRNMNRSDDLRAAWFHQSNVIVDCRRIGVVFGMIFGPLLDIGTNLSAHLVEGALTECGLKIEAWVMPRS